MKRVGWMGGCAPSSWPPCVAKGEMNSNSIRFCIHAGGGTAAAAGSRSAATKRAGTNRARVAEAAVEQPGQRKAQPVNGMIKC